MSLLTCNCYRWAFNLQKAFENDNLEYFYRKAIQSVTEEDYQKIIAYRHKDDSLACLAGRLFLRQAAHKFTKEEWQKIELARTDRGKPYVIKPESFFYGINVSHQGDYAVFASSCGPQIGVDVMRLEMTRGNKTADEYINSMAKSASPIELQTMRCQATDQMKMTVFYRYWCLKEAILKATGEGIVNDLSNYDFRIDPHDRYRPGCFLTTTTLYENGKLQSQWVFEESFVDNTHSIAVCRQKKLPKTCQFYTNANAKKFFSEVDFDFLLNKSTIINPLKNDAADEFYNFIQKPKKRF